MLGGAFFVGGISTHALLTEGDHGAVDSRPGAADFYPRPPHGGRPWSRRLPSGSRRFLSTPSVRRATVQRPSGRCCPDISIHALREEGDATARDTTCRRMNFYPRPPRGGRPRRIMERGTPSTFLSAPSARRATHLVHRMFTGHGISIHALREEGDVHFGGLNTLKGLFLSTPSARRATCRVRLLKRASEISIHALREEGDVPQALPAQPFAISIHALREEGDGRNDARRGA